jgi:hypothetical protein
MIEFFEHSELLEYEVLRPLSHIRGNWELTSGNGDYHFEIEDDSFARELSELVDELDQTKTPKRYHDNEDNLVEYVRGRLGKEIKKVGNRWQGRDYQSILQDAGFYDFKEENLVQSAKGRIEAAQKYGQEHYDDMEQGHRKMLGLLLALIIYHREARA